MRIPLVSDDAATSQQMNLFEESREAFGWVPNTLRVMANGQAGPIYLGADQLNRCGTLKPAERELLAVVVARHNGCQYCLTAHSVAARGHGVSEDQVLTAQRAGSDDDRTAAILGFAEAVLECRGHVSDDLLGKMRLVGVDHTTLVDIIAVIAENCLGNFINNVAETQVDPVVERAAKRVVPGLFAASGA